jgi:hypothetical protein
MKIMTDPVFDPRFPQFNFEKSEILRWLRIKQEHPFNRTALRSDQLVHNVTLKQDINKFVDDTVGLEVASEVTQFDEHSQPPQQYSILSYKHAL